MGNRLITLAASLGTLGWALATGPWPIKLTAAWALVMGFAVPMYLANRKRP